MPGISSAVTRRSSLLRHISSYKISSHRPRLATPASLYPPSPSSPLWSQRRQISFYPIKALGKFVRFPAYAGGAVVAGASYISYKVQEAQSYTMDKVTMITDWFNKGLDGLANGLDEVAGGLDGFMSAWGDPENAANMVESSNSESSPNTDLTTRPLDDDDEENRKNQRTKQAMRFLMGAILAAIAEQPDPVIDNDDPRMTSLKTLPRPLTDEEIALNIKTILNLKGQVDHIPGPAVVLPSLPTVVLVGPNQNDKREVLEALVGHSFLPTIIPTRNSQEEKEGGGDGNLLFEDRNWPLELILVNDPDRVDDYAQFDNHDESLDQLATLRTADFGQIQNTLAQILQNQPMRTEVVKLSIHSKNVPDLTLVDPPRLTAPALVDSNYLHDNSNILLSVSSIDEDTLGVTREICQMLDPAGTRTVSVVTELDQLTPSGVVDLLTQHKGTIGMLSGIGPENSRATLGQIRDTYERQYLQNNHELFNNDISIGTTTLRQRLMHKLHRAMLDSLPEILDAVNQDLEEATYAFKVKYNDQPLTAESYMAASLDSFKLRFQEFSSNFGREEVRGIIKSELDQKVLDLLAQRYWNRPERDSTQLSLQTSLPPPPAEPISQLSSSSPENPHWQHQLDSATSTLTKLGIGRLSTSLIISALLDQMDLIVSQTALSHHQLARDTILATAQRSLQARYFTTADQVENCIKPYKYEVDPDEREWKMARGHAYSVLREELRQCEAALKTLTSSSSTSPQGARPSSSRQRRGELGNFGNSSLSNSQLDLNFLRDRRDLLKLRLMAIKSPQCNTRDNKYYCPEVFLNAVADKLTKTAVLFLNVELLADFYHNFPAELDAQLAPAVLKQSGQLEDLAYEDIKVREHIELQRRKELLEDLAKGIGKVISKR